MSLLRFLLCLFIFVGALAAAGALVLSILLILRFPPLLLVVVLACEPPHSVQPRFCGRERQALQPQADSY